MEQNTDYFRMLFIFLVLTAMLQILSGDAIGQRIYSWTDKEGTLHITDKPPPKNAERVNIYRVTPTGQSQQKDRGNTDLKAVDALQDYERLQEEKEEAEEKAEKARKKAIEARRKANIAVAEADRVKAETVELAKKQRNGNKTGSNLTVKNNTRLKPSLWPRRPSPWPRKPKIWHAWPKPRPRGCGSLH